MADVSFMTTSQHWLQKIPEKVEVFAGNNGQPHITRNHRKEGEQGQRNGHDGWRFMDVRLDFWSQPFLPMECQKDEAEHVKGCHDCAQDPQNPDKIIPVGISRGENRIL